LEIQELLNNHNNSI